MTHEGAKPESPHSLGFERVLEINIDLLARTAQPQQPKSIDEMLSLLQPGANEMASNALTTYIDRDCTVRNRTMLNDTYRAAGFDLDNTSTYEWDKSDTLGQTQHRVMVLTGPNGSMVFERYQKTTAYGSVRESFWADAYDADQGREKLEQLELLTTE